MIRRFVQMPVAFLLAGLLVAAPRARSAEPQQPASRSLPIENIYDDRDTQVETVADSLEYQKEQKKVIAKGNVVITHGSEKITADYAEVDRETKLAFAKGHVIVFQGESAVAKGEEIYYD